VSHLPLDEPAVTRSGFVRFQQELACQALLAGSIGAARLALRVLRPGDFAGEPAVIAKYLKRLRDARSSDDEILEAVRALIALRPAE
jgi:hypothetical protein